MPIDIYQDEEGYLVLPSEKPRCPAERIIGVLTPKATIIGSLSVKPSIVGSLSIPKVVMPSPYAGPYEAKPKVGEQVILPTSGHYLSQNVTVDEVPFWETSNVGGGITFIIGEQ